MRNIKNNIWMSLKLLVGRNNYERIRAYYNLGYCPKINNPQTFNEKIMNKKLHTNMGYATALSDKYEVREYVKSKVGEHILNKIYYIGEDLSNLDWTSLPNRFVIKTTHGGGSEGNVFVHNNKTADLKEITNKVGRNLSSRFGSFTNECWYTDIKPRVLVEELMLDDSGQIPFDYKFFCFHGKCHYIQVDADRFGKHTRSFYDIKWVYQDFSLLYERGEKLEKPVNLDDMITVAESLSEGFDFVRVDLYSLNGKTRFGEMTFAPGSGWEPFTPASMDKTLGKLF